MVNSLTAIEHAVQLPEELPSSIDKTHFGSDPRS
jgi:hypothetical protein